jgi:hypothetical protein
MVRPVFANVLGSTPIPAPFLLRLVAERKLACWKTEGPSETGEDYFFARADLEALRPAVEEAG